MHSEEHLKHTFLEVHFPLILVQVFFAALPTLSKIAFRTFSPDSVAFFRIVCSMISFGLIFFCFLKEKIKESKHLLHLFILAIFGVTCSQYLFIRGVALTTAINAGILIATIPISTLLIAVLLKKEKLTLNKTLGVLIAFTGVSLLLNITNLQFTQFLKGNILVLINATSFSFYLVISKPILKIYRPFTVITYLFFFGSLQMVPLTVHSLRDIPFSTLTPNQIWPLLGIIIFGTLLPYLLNTLVLKKTYSSIVAIYTYIQPLLGAVVAYTFLGEQITIRFVFAGILILLGVTLVNFHKIPFLPNFLLSMIRLTR